MAKPNGTGDTGHRGRGYEPSGPGIRAIGARGRVWSLIGVERGRHIRGITKTYRRVERSSKLGAPLPFGGEGQIKSTGSKVRFLLHGFRILHRRLPCLFWLIGTDMYSHGGILLCAPPCPHFCAGCAAVVKLAALSCRSEPLFSPSKT